jgi:hypothetical protein
MDIKYKVLRGSTLFRQLSELHARMQAVNAKAKKIVKEVGADGFSAGRNCIAGGIRAFHFKDLHKQAGWHACESGSTPWFFPNGSDRRNEDLLQRIKALPSIELMN